MTCVITHMDSDGVISLSFILRVRRVERVYFTSPTQLKDTLCYSMIGNKNLEEVIITDLTGSRETLILSSVYQSALWLDHHEWEDDLKIPENVKVVVKPGSKSAARVVAEYFGIESKLVDMADEIDTNSVESEEARFIRNVVGAIRLNYHGMKLNEKLMQFALDLNKEDFSLLKEKYGEMEEEYQKHIERIANQVREKTRIYNIANLKVGIFETTESIPVYVATNELEDKELDILIVVSYRMNRNGKPYTKLEFRTHTGKDVLKIAKFFGGGGHILASGATVPEIVTVTDILNVISMLYGKEGE